MAYDTSIRNGHAARILTVCSEYPAIILAAIAIAVFGLFDDRFLTIRNIQNVANQSSYLLILALAQTVVLLGRGFDLSMGSAVSLISVAVALATTGQFAAGVGGAVAVAIALLVALSIGVFIGGVLGLLSGVLGANSFIISLGMMNVCIGLASIISGGRPVFNVPTAVIASFNTGTMLWLPAPLVISVLVCLALHLMLSKTVYGRLLYLVGSNPKAVHVAGHNPRTIIAWSFVIAGALVALSALLLTARTGTGEPNLGANLLLQAIAAAVIGGVSLAGGKGSVWQAVFGALTITVFSNVLNLMQVSGYIQSIALGAIIIGALWLERSR